jgi:hypothetical protein
VYFLAVGSKELPWFRLITDRSKSSKLPLLRAEAVALGTFLRLSGWNAYWRGSAVDSLAASPTCSFSRLGLRFSGTEKSSIDAEYLRSSRVLLLEPSKSSDSFGRTS